MITVISGSNRSNNKTVHFAKFVFEELKKNTDEEIRFLDLSSLDGSLVSETMYKDSEQPEIIQNIQNTYFIPANKFWFFVPEYNGSYPGIVKLVLDSISVRAYNESFANKKACITGIASGRAGNLRGMDHLADVLNHLGMYVHPNKNPISSIYKLLDKESNNVNIDTSEILKKQASQLLAF
ncbi:hypothetical protein MTsPCn9_19270 [Croceitalea sp. MTPC9]|uniref:NADPH-dependent FMN reductase n=1 Tax=unclassified Croceitalea TaxID=2632280 RepID=UPI002B3D3041|nr:hypothetical protein MTsPCn6_12120 [Croceitalea sp. MTPC6]GMN16991.1 hypothetical protein MTsPCn9_19270 [Croceitalea sp. MTPC9]